MIRSITVYKPTKAGAEAIRSALKARGVNANVRFFATSYRIVLPKMTDDAKAEVRDLLVEFEMVTSGSCHYATDLDAYERAWSTYEGRGQIFVAPTRPAAWR